MAKKVTAFLLFTLIILCVILGIYFLVGDKEENKTPDTTQNNTSAPTSVVSVNDVPTEPETEYKPDSSELDDNTDDITTTNFKISQVVDHTTGEVVQPRVVFGSGFNVGANYITFDSTGKFEMYFSGFSDVTRAGTYEDHGEIIYVEYTDGKAAEYDLVRDSDNKIIYIVVNYGDYDVYFA